MLDDILSKCQDAIEHNNYWDTEAYAIQALELLDKGKVADAVDIVHLRKMLEAVIFQANTANLQQKTLIEEITSTKYEKPYRLR